MLRQRKGENMAMIQEPSLPRYQLRQAAGSYWILDMWQEGLAYKKPLAINEVGADIWKMLEKHKTNEEIASFLCGKYRVEPEEVMTDIVQFQEKLLEYKISLSYGE